MCDYVISVLSTLMQSKMQLGQRNLSFTLMSPRFSTDSLDQRSSKTHYSRSLNQRSSKTHYSRY